MLILRQFPPMCHMYRSGRSDRSVEFPADAADVESLPGAGDGKYCGAEAGDVHATKCAVVC